MVIEDICKILIIMRNVSTSPGFQRSAITPTKNNNPSNINELCEQLTPIPKELITLVVKNLAKSEKFNDETAIRYVSDHICFTSNFSNELQIYQRDVSSQLNLFTELLKFEESQLNINYKQETTSEIDTQTHRN